MSSASRSCAAAAVALALLNCAPAVHAAGTNLKSVPNLKLQPLATYDAGEAGSAEIVAFDATSKRLFLVNAGTATVDILDVRHPTSPTLVATINTSALGSPNSVAVARGVVAVAIESNPKTSAGHVAFYTSSGELIKAVTVGALPDMIAFTPDTFFVLTANEGEPSGYGAGH